MPKGQRRTLSMDDLQALIETIRGGSATKTLDTETKANLDQEFKSQIEKYHAEPHYWVTFHKMGDDDNVDTVYIGAAGVGYTCRKGERVLLPQSALNCMKYAVREGLDHGRPVEVNGRKYLRKVRQPMHNYTVEPEVVTPEEAAKWRAHFEKQILEAQDLVPLDGGHPLDDLVEVGR